MANEFNKEERVAFEQLLEGFQDAEVMSRNVAKYNTDQQMMERGQDTIWRPQPYIMNSFSGTDMTDNFNDKVQLSVPASINIEKSVPWIMSQTELRDALQEGRLGDGARQKLASDINVSILSIVGLQGSLVVPISVSATGFDDVAEVEAIMNEQGVPGYDRYLALSTRDYNNMASNLAARETMNDIVKNAYKKAYVGTIASFETFKLDYSNQLAAASGGAAITIDTTDDSTNFYTPTALQASPTTSERLNKDNRFQTVTVNATSGIAAGDCFTIANVYAVHQITKASTGQLKTFRVISIASSTTMVITPPIIDPTSDQNGEAAVQYQNVYRSDTGSATAAIVFKNSAAAKINPFWQKDAIEILPGRYVVPANTGAAVMRGTTDSGLELVMTKQFDINTYKTKYRLDTRYGVVNKAPEMSGILLFAQT